MNCRVRNNPGPRSEPWGSTEQLLPSFYLEVAVSKSE